MNVKKKTLKTSIKKVREPISVEILFEKFVKKIEWNQEAVAAENPYSPDQIVAMAYSSIKKYGLYQDNCQEWSRKPRLKKTWINFKDHFA